MKRATLVLLVTAALIVLESQPIFAQCAMCRRALQSPEGQRMVAALRTGILVLLMAPFAVFGAVATLATRRFRRR